MFSQTLVNDTIDYNFFINNSTLFFSKIVEGKYNFVRTFKYKGPYAFLIVEKMTDICPRNNTENIQLGDTLLWADWDIEDTQGQIKKHACGKISLNENANTFILEKFKFHGLDTGAVKRRKFKILKMTKKEVILFDCDYPKRNIKYYFK